MAWTPFLKEQCPEGEPSCAKVARIHGKSAFASSTLEGSVYVGGTQRDWSQDSLSPTPVL